MIGKPTEASPRNVNWGRAGDRVEGDGGRMKGDSSPVGIVAMLEAEMSGTAKRKQRFITGVSSLAMYT